MSKSIAIIGGWAAGMMAIAHITQKNPQWVRIVLFEKNSSLGAKVIISGWGRCNVTTGYYRRKDLESKYIRWSERVREAIGQFGPRKTYQWFESHWVPLKIEKDMRVFPQSDNGKDIVWVFETIIKKSSVECILSTWIEHITKTNGQFLLTTKDKEYAFDAVIIATGGQAYRQTGSTGDAYDWAQNLWHTITPLWPSLNSFLTSDKWMHALSGIAFENATLEILLSSWTSVKDPGYKQKKASWPLLLTHFGLSGPLAFIISAYSSFEMIDHNKPLLLKLMIDSNADKTTRDKRLLEASNQTPKKQLDTILAQYLPKRLVEAILAEKFPWQALQPIGQISKIIRLWIGEFLWWGWTISVVGRRPGDEFVTAGGVSLDEVDNSTMMSKLVPWLFFAGEVLDIDGVTGWYNLTSSRATGACAGESAIEFLS